MKKLFNFMLLALMVMSAACSSDDDIYEDGSETGDKIIIGIGMPEENGTRVSTEDLFNLKWENGDKIFLMGYDNNGNYVGKSNGDIISGAGTKYAKFSTSTVEGADKYMIYYNNQVRRGPVQFDDKGNVSVNYQDQVRYRANESATLKETLLLGSDMIPAGKITSGTTVKIRNSVLKLNIQNMNPEQKGAAIADITWKANGKEMCYSPMADVRINEGEDNFFYFSFDPANDLPKNGKIEIIINANHSVKIASAISKNGKNYEPGMIYNIPIGNKENGSWGFMKNEGGEVAPEPVDPSQKEWADNTFWVYGLKNMPEYDTWKVYDPIVYGGELDWKAEYGWYDCLKVDPTGPHDPYNGVNVSDHRLCWAATCSNLIHWWLDRNAENIKKYNQMSGSNKYYGPSAYPNALQSEVFQFFKDHFNDHGGHGFNGLNYFFKGIPVNYDGSISHGAHDGFFRDVILDESYLWRRGTAATLSEDLKKAFTNHEAIYIGVRANDGAHAITIWGAKFDANGDVCQIYVADNNDNEMQFDQSITNPWKVTSRINARNVKKINGVYYMEGGRFNSGSFQITIYDTLFLGTNETEWDNFFKRHNM